MSPTGSIPVFLNAVAIAQFSLPGRDPRRSDRSRARRPRRHPTVTPPVVATSELLRRHTESLPKCFVKVGQVVEAGLDGDGRQEEREAEQKLVRPLEPERF